MSGVFAMLAGVPRVVVDAGPFRYAQIHGPHRSPGEQFHVGRLLRVHDLQPGRCEFALEEIPLIDLIESALVEAHDKGNSAFDFVAWRAEGAPEAPLRAEFAGAIDAARERMPQNSPRLDYLAALYAKGEEVEPLVAIHSDRGVLSSGDKALILIDGHHRTFAAALAGVERLPVYVLVRDDAVFSY